MANPSRRLPNAQIDTTARSSEHFRDSGRFGSSGRRLQVQKWPRSRSATTQQKSGQHRASAASALQNTHLPKMALRGESCGKQRSWRSSVREPLQAAQGIERSGALGCGLRRRNRARRAESRGDCLRWSVGLRQSEEGGRIGTQLAWGKHRWRRYGRRGAEGCSHTP